LFDRSDLRLNPSSSFCGTATPMCLPLPKNLCMPRKRDLEDSTRSSLFGDVLSSSDRRPASADKTLPQRLRHPPPPGVRFVVAALGPLLDDVLSSLSDRGPESAGSADGTPLQRLRHLSPPSSVPLTARCQGGKKWGCTRKTPPAAAIVSAPPCPLFPQGGGGRCRYYPDTWDRPCDPGATS
jgi:hypothetical protein